MQSPPTSEPTRLVDIESALTDATMAFKKARTAAASARHAETNALNRLRETQKAFDTKVAELRRGAPAETDWGAPARKEGMV